MWYKLKNKWQINPRLVAPLCTCHRQFGPKGGAQAESHKSPAGTEPPKATGGPRYLTATCKHALRGINLHNTGQICVGNLADTSSFIMQTETRNTFERAKRQDRRDDDAGLASR